MTGTGAAQEGRPHLFEARDVTCTVTDNGTQRTIFRDLSFAIDAGQIVDLTGASGAGKSTLLRAFARLDINTTGTFILNGKNSQEMTPQQWRSHVSYLPQSSTLIGETVADAIRLPWTFHVRAHSASRSAREQLSDDTIRAFLDEVGCNDIPLDRPPADLSGGQAARVSLARTMLTKPTLLLADEVDAGLDAENASRVGAILTKAAQSGMAIMRVRHRATDHRANRTLIIVDGTLRNQGDDAVAHEYGDAGPVPAVATSTVTSTQSNGGAATGTEH